jgi:hypothetical protein
MNRYWPSKAGEGTSKEGEIKIAKVAEVMDGKQWLEVG